ncbi:porin family protein [Pontibacter litorisediminis]|uniref:porin family protein n=1 Tax=Pontibacter litorisediminis TaxID=1846260 RepID=UPI0023ECF75D|nr:porin family protein [Pontibacter litorisediminis]
MKKASLIFLSLFAALHAHAQDAFVPELSIGLKGGVNFSRFNFNPEADQEFLQGYTGGLVLKHQAHPRVGLQVELNYVQRGWAELPNTGGAVARRLDYLELPLMTHVTIGNRGTRFLINLGPYASYLLSGGTPGKGGEAVRYWRRELDNDFLYGLCVGLGMGQKTSFGTFQLEGRLSHSLNDIFERDTGVLAAKSQSVSVTLSYLLSFKAEAK